MKIRKTYLILFVGLAMIAALIVWGQFKKKPAELTVVKVVRGNLVQTVEPSGAVKSQSEIKLNFDAVGRLAAINVKVGNTVKAGQLLAKLDTRQLDSAVAQASADLTKAKGNLNAYEAGATAETIAQYEADVQKAEANLTKAQADLANLKISLKQTFDNAYINQINTLQGSITTLETAMTDMDTVLGVENTSANDTFDKALITLDDSSFYYSQAKTDFNNARLKLNEAKTAIQTLAVSSANAEIDAATTKAKTALGAVATALDSTWTVLDKVDVNNPSNNLTISQVTAKKTTIDTDRAAITVKKTSVLSVEQATATARLNYEGGVDSAISSQVAQYEANEKIYEASLASAQASLAAKQAPPRPVDLESYQAAVKAAEAALGTAAANRNKALIYAPLDGVITQKNNEVGEANSSVTPVLVMLASADYIEIETNISEADISKVSVGQAAQVVLDAFGPERVFDAKVATIDPAETLISDVVYYKATLVLTSKDVQEVRPGMTASVTIYTNKKDNVLMIPERAVLQKDGKKYARVVTDKTAGSFEEKEISTGLRGNDGLVEITSGLAENEEVVTFIQNGQ